MNRMEKLNKSQTTGKFDDQIKKDSAKGPTLKQM